MDTLNADERFYFMVENAVVTDAGKGTLLLGRIHGNVHAKGPFYLQSPRGKTIMTDIKSMTAQDLQEASENVPVNILIDRPAAEVEKYSILTNIEPQAQVDVHKAVENPVIAGLLFEVENCSGDKEYLNRLFYAVAHGHFVTPVQLSSPPKENQNGTATFEKNTTLAFFMIPDPREEGKCVLPVFTDWAELGKWKSIMGDQRPNTMILAFPDIAAVTGQGQGNCNGFVINPYSENRILLDKHYIEMITGSEGYRREFCNKDKNASVQEHKMEKDTKVQIGTPAPSDEVRMIRGELTVYGKKNKDIRAIYLLLKKELGPTETVSYLVILDTDAADPKKHFAAIYECIKNYTVDIRLVDFIVKGQIPGIDKGLNESQLVYKA